LHYFNDRIVRLHTTYIRWTINVHWNSTLNQCELSSSIHLTLILCQFNLSIANNIDALTQWLKSFKWFPNIMSMMMMIYINKTLIQSMLISIIPMILDFKNTENDCMCQAFTFFMNWNWNGANIQFKNWLNWINLQVINKIIIIENNFRHAF
jgi:hypothetical protein